LVDLRSACYRGCSHVDASPFELAVDEATTRANVSDPTSGGWSMAWASATALRMALRDSMLVLVWVAAVAGGCDQQPDPETTAGDDAGDPSTGAPDTGAPETGVACGDAVTCAPGQLCRRAPLGCDYSACQSGGSAVWTGGALHCVDFPAECEQDPPDVVCLQTNLCSGAWDSSFGSGQLMCGGGAQDCFC